MGICFGFITVGAGLLYVVSFVKYTPCGKPAVDVLMEDFLLQSWESFHGPTVCVPVHGVHDVIRPVVFSHVVLTDFGGVCCVPYCSSVVGCYFLCSKVKINLEAWDFVALPGGFMVGLLR